jgi:hypothetical protein
MYMKKFEFNKETSYFCIDPLHLAAGLKAAEGKYADIHAKPMDLRSKDLALDMAMLSSCTWIKRLNFERDIPIPKDEFKLLERLVNLEELSIKEFTPLDYSKFPRLKQLILTAGTDLPGLDKLRSLEFLYLGLWNSETLPKSIGAIAATKVRISASKKLSGIEPLCDLAPLESLMMQYLPALKVGKEINKLTSLKDLHVEKCGWTDFSSLRIDSLRKLFASKVESLRFLKQLKNLDHLFFWECVDGDLTPVLEHPTLTRIDFTPAKKHYSHKLPELRQLLAARRAGKA